MIVDEAHNAMTGLSREMQARVNPCAIVEFTATPQLNSNILHNVTAQELKREEMIKLPIVLSEHGDWRSAISVSIATRAALAEKALLDTAGYIRPIVLFQAQPRDEEVTVEILKKHLIETENIPEDKIAVATGDQRDLDAIDLFRERLEPRLDDPAYSLSYANRRRLEIARALVSEPRLLLLDEPTAGMNPHETAGIVTLIQAIRDMGITVFLIEHDMKVIMNASDRIIVLDHGEKIAEGLPGEIRANEDVIQAYMGRRGARA